MPRISAKNIFHIHTLRRRIIVSFISVIAAFMLLALGVTWQANASLFVKEYTNVLVSSVSDFSKLSNAYLTAVKRWTEPIYTRTEYIDYLTGKSASLDARNNLRSTVCMIPINNSEILSADFYIERERSCWAIDQSSMLMRDLEKIDCPYDYDSSSRSIYRLVPGGENGVIFSSVMHITDAPRDTLLATAVFGITAQSLDDLLEDASMYPGEAVYLLNSSLDTLYVKGLSPMADTARDFFQTIDLSSRSVETVSHRGEAYLVYARKLPDHPVYALRIVPKRELVDNANRALGTIVWIYVLCIAGAVLMAVLLSYRILNPIQRLGKAIERLGSGEFGEKIDIPPQDAEIQRLIDRFNDMSEKIRRLFQETYQLKLSQQTAVLKALQSQINPHFLYNTLQSIHLMALERNAFEINLIVDALSKILKYCLRSGSSLVALGEELEMVGEYLTIQQVRFPDRLSVAIEADEASRHWMIPRMTLQPLVENSIQHGFQDSGSDCFIRIRCFVDKDRLSIWVEDDGLGMGADRLRDVRDSLKDSLDKVLEGRHIGLRNCYMRLKYQYAESVSMQIESQPGHGTGIHIAIDGKECLP